MLGRNRVEKGSSAHVVVTGGPCSFWRRLQPRVGLSYRGLSLLVENAYDALSCPLNDIPKFDFMSALSMHKTMMRIMATDPATSP